VGHQTNNVELRTKRSSIVLGRQNMLRKIGLNLTLFVLLIGGLSPFELVKGARQNIETKSHINLLYSSNEMATFELLTPEYSLEMHHTEHGTFQKLWVEGYGYTELSGYPQIPGTSVLLGIPTDSEVRIVFSGDNVVRVEGMDNILPTPRTIAWEGNPEAIQLSYAPNPEIYSQSHLFPNIPVRVEEYGWLRDQRYVRIGLYPFQYSPADGAILWHQKLSVQVHFEGSVIQQEFSGGEINSFDGNRAFENLLQSQILNYEEARAWRVQPTVEANHQTSVTGERLRIAVDHDGLYRIGYTDLVNAGLGATDPRTFQMTNQGIDVAITVVGEEDGTLDEGDYILFFGEEFHGETMASWYADENQHWVTYTQQLSDGTTSPWHPEFNSDMVEKYTTENVYWLQSVTDITPTRMQIVDGTPGEAAVPAYYHAIAHAEVQQGRWEYHFTSEDTWFWSPVTAASSQSFSTQLSAIYTEPFTAVVRSEYVAFSYNSLVSPDHHTVFRLNGQPDPINESFWDGRSRHSFEENVPSSYLVEGDNQLHFSIIEDDPIYVYSLIYFDWFEIEYLRRFVAENDTLLFPGEVSGTWRYQVEGFNQADLILIDITNPHLPKRVANVQTHLDGTYRAEFQYTHDNNARFYVLGANAIQAPKDISRYVPADLRSTNNGADYLIVAHADFLDTAQTLANYRVTQGLRVRIVDVQDVYNEFNEGIRHPIAIKNFLEYAFAQWLPPAPLYVVLVGDGHWDILDNRYTTEPVYMPPNLSWVDPNQGEVDSSNLLATIIGDDPLPDLHIGRIPVKTPQEFENVIEKIISFEQAPNQGWQLNNTFIADNTPDADGNFPDMADYIISRYITPDFIPIRIYEDDFGCTTYPCPAVTAKIAETLNITGTLFTTYIGHASIQNWSHERILNPNDISALNNTNQLPVVLSMDCLDGYWIHPVTQPSMAEAFLMSAGKGGAATFSPTGLAVGFGHLILMEGFFGAVFQNGVWEMGAATLGAKITLYEAGFFRDMLQTYTIFGDPALKFPSPYGLGVSPIMAEGGGLPGSQVTYILQISNLGALPDTIELVVEGNSWVTTLSDSVLELIAGESTDITVTVDIPGDASLGMTDTSFIRVMSSGDAAEQESVVISSIAALRISLPMIRK